MCRVFEHRHVQWTQQRIRGKCVGLRAESFGLGRGGDDLVGCVRFARGRVDDDAIRLVGEALRSERVRSQLLSVCAHLAHLVVLMCGAG